MAFVVGVQGVRTTDEGMATLGGAEAVLLRTVPLKDAAGTRLHASGIKIGSD